MFGLFGKKKQKTDVEILIEKDGIELSANRFAAVISKMLKTQEIAYQFILEEIEAASMGDYTAKNFAKNSGITPEQYLGAMNNSRPEIDGSGGPQQFIIGICHQIKSNGTLKVDFRIKIVDNIMKNFQIGKYSVDTLPNIKNAGTITSPFNPSPELQTEAGVRNYLSKISKLTHSDLCAEFSCVMAAKFNIMKDQAGLSDYRKKQEIVKDLNDKAAVICMAEFGQPAVFGYAGGDMRSFNELLQNIDDEVAQMDLEPAQHGNMLLRKLREHL